MIYNVGICDVNNCEILDNDGKLSKCYNTWHDMLRRCYSDGYQTYKDCSVCDEWKFYSVFREWFYDNYYKVDDEEMNLDKDLLVKNNKIYCPEKC